jgi:hypothetical protein
MKNIINIGVLTMLGFGLSGCANQSQPFNPNIKKIIFNNGIPYNIPRATHYSIVPISKTVESLFVNIYDINLCHNNDLYWWKQGKKDKKMNVNKSAFSLLYAILTKDIKNHGNDLFKSYKYNSKVKSLPDYNIFISSFRNINDNTTLYEIANNKKLLDYIYRNFQVLGRADSIKSGVAGCVSPMSQQEYQYYTNKELQNRQFQHDRNIQNKKSLDRSMDRMQNQLNNMTPQQHNVDVFVY